MVLILILLTFKTLTPTNQVFSIGTNLHVNKSSDNFIAYCFHSVDGYSKVGSWIGNDSTDGTFVHCGFSPKYIMLKSASAAQPWHILDDERSTYNVVDDYLQADSTAVEVVSHSSFKVDMLSNGFKIRCTDGSVNTLNDTYIFIAFAEYPAKYTTAR